MFGEPINAVTVCRHYSSELEVTIPHNKIHFNRWTIVTTEDDKKTQSLCAKHGLHCLITGDDKRDGAFSKGRMIERGLHHCHAHGWMIHIDADIVLPYYFRKHVEMAHLETRKIYGVDRIMVHSREDWNKLAASGWLLGIQADYPHGVGVPEGYQLGSRWMGADGYVPIGFFQMWHRGGGGEEKWGIRTKPYPTSHGTACRTDVQFALQWDRRDRVLIPEIFVAHLEGTKAKKGSNWNGRTTPEF